MPRSRKFGVRKRHGNQHRNKKTLNQSIISAETMNECQSTALNLNQICRLCMAYEDDLSSIFETSNADLPEKITALTSVVVLIGDGLPQQMCQQCKQQLNLMYTFRLQCQTSDAVLQEYIRQTVTVKTESISEEYFKSTAQGHPDEVLEIKKEVNEDGIHLEDSKVDMEIDIVEDLWKNADPPYEVQDTPSQVASKDHLGVSLSSYIKPVVRVEHTEGSGQPSLRDAYKNLFCKPAFTPLSEKKQQLVTLKCNPYQCHICNASFKCDLELKTHLRNHAVGKCYECKMCGNCFRKRLDLHKHEETVHISHKTYECEVCKKQFLRKSQFFNHTRNRSVIPLECDTCKQRFCRKSRLTEHVKAHSDKPIKCTVCDLKFHNGDAWSAHIKTHRGEHLYKCEVCNNTFVQSRDLAQHIKIHTGERAHKCVVCKTSFAHPESIVEHLKLHLNNHQAFPLSADQQSFECKMCFKTFSKSSGLLLHLRKCHKEVM